MKGAPRSKQFDDVYFSAEDGLAETTHVFLNGNDLPARWGSARHFTIAETGFGTGLNFLAVWKLFEDNRTHGQSLEFISVEKYPLSADEIAEVLKDWDKQLGSHHRAALCKYYPEKCQGECILALTEYVTLRLFFGDVNEILPSMEAEVDCWFLDGFKPSSNPDMWSETVFEHMARLSKQGASFATFTAAGFVRRGLQAAGFEVRKVPGYGRKREMIVGNKIKNH